MSLNLDGLLFGIPDVRVRLDFVASRVLDQSRGDSLLVECKFPAYSGTMKRSAVHDHHVVAYDGDARLPLYL